MSHHNPGDVHAFRHRGTEINRLEAFTDAVFAFAVTLLVVSLEVPKSSAELFHAMRGFLAFGICFTFLILIWYDHHRFNRRYGLTYMLLGPLFTLQGMRMGRRRRRLEKAGSAA